MEGCMRDYMIRYFPLTLAPADPRWKELRLKLMKVDQTMHFIHGARFLYDVALDGAATGASLAFSARSNNRTIYAGKETALQLSFTGTTGDAIAAPVTGMVGGCTEPTANGHVSPCDPILLPVFSRKWEKSESGESMQINVRYLTKAIIDVGYYGDDYVRALPGRLSALSVP